MKYINRKESVITGKLNLEHLYVFKNFPVFMGCTDQNESEDIKADMSFSICRDTGIIQLDKLLPLDLVYLSQHNDGIGKIWQDHYIAFSKFLGKFNPKKILEIGGANDFIANYFLSKNPASKWTIIEPHPLFEESEKIKIIKGWFDNSFSFDEQVDTIVHSHVFEHTYHPVQFIMHIAKFLKQGGKHIFTFPSMVEMLSKKYTNCLNFEHTAFLAEPFVDYILAKNGFKVIGKEHFHDHSIFYATEKIDDMEIKDLAIPNKYSEYKKLFLDFITYHKQLVNKLSIEIEKFEGEVFLFGAHIFSQYLFEFGLKKEKIVSILDNSPLKQKKRLYGTSFNVQSPEVLKGRGKVGVILKVGIYRNEIIKQLKEINSNILFFE